MDEINKEVEIFECPICSGPGILEEENGWCFYVMCMDCGCHTAELPFHNEEERQAVARHLATTWNLGKVISPANGD